MQLFSSNNFQVNARGRRRAIPFLVACLLIAGATMFFPDIFAPYRRVIGGVCIGLLFIALGARVWPRRFE